MRGFLVRGLFLCCFYSSASAGSLTDMGLAVKDFCRGALENLSPFEGLARVIGNRNLRLATEVKNSRFTRYSLPERVLNFMSSDGQLTKIHSTGRSGIYDQLTGLFLYIENGILNVEIPLRIKDVETLKKYPLPEELSKTLYTSEGQAAQKYHEALVDFIDQRVAYEMYGSLEKKTIQAIITEVDQYEARRRSTRAQGRGTLDDFKIEKVMDGAEPVGFSISGELRDGQAILPFNYQPGYIEGASEQSNFDAKFRVRNGYIEIEVRHELVERPLKEFPGPNHTKVLFKPSERPSGIYRQTIPLHHLFSPSGELSVISRDGEPKMSGKSQPPLSGDLSFYLFSQIPLAIKHGEKVSDLPAKSPARSRAIRPPLKLIPQPEPVLP